VTPVSKVKTPKIRTLTEPKGPGVKNNATEQFKNLHPGRLRKEHRARMELQKTDKDIIMKITSLDDITKLQSDRQYKFVMLSNDDIYVGGPTSLETGTALKHSVLSYAVQKPEVITAGMMRYSPDIGEGVVFLINKSGHHRSTESSLQYASKKLSSLGAEVRSNRRS
jgi:glucosamine 6-phosphate synthetase-like amidotransferase/phosphosugar isomerase protein